MKVSEINQSDFAIVWEKEDLGLFLNPHLTALNAAGMVFLKVETAQDTAVYFSCYAYKSWGFRFVINPLGMAYCGFQLVNPPDSEAKCIALKADAIKAVTSYLIETYPSGTLDLRFEPSNMVSPSISGVDMSLGKHAFLDLSLSESELFLNLSSRRKRNIKKESKGYEVNAKPPLDKVMILLDYTFEKSNSQNLKSFYRAGLSGEGPILRANLVSLNGEALATNVVAYDSGVAYYFLGGIDPNQKDPNAGTIVMWNAILQAKMNGIKTFNFCGSSIPSISEYFKSFGASEAQYMHIRKGSKLVERLKRLKEKS